MTRLRALAVSLAAVVLAAVAMWAPASADGEPLTLEISVSPRTCTAGSLAVATWQISGGEQPYQLTIDGQTVDADAGSATVRCGSSLSGAPAWLSEVVRHLTVRAEVVDAAGATMVAETTLVPALPLPPPRLVSARVGQSWRDWRLATGYVYVKAVESLRGAADAPPPGSRQYLARWREQGATLWTYGVFDWGREDHWDPPYRKAPPPGAINTIYGRAFDGARAATPYEFQVSRLRDLIEQETPEALRWSPPQTTISAGPPRDVIVHVTRDSATVSWESNLESTEWRISLTGHPESPDAYRVAPGPWDDIRRVADSTSHTMRFADLIPGRDYTVVLGQSMSSVRSEAKFDIRTEGIASEAELAMHRPRITRADVVDGTLHIEWMPPPVGSERHYAASAREYGVQDPAVGFVTQLGATQETIADIKPATTYRVVVKTVDGHGGRDERIIETPLGLPEDRDWRWPISPRLRAEWVEYSRYGGFRVSWDPIEDDEIAQVKWERDGYVMSSIGTSPILISVDEPGRYAFRARLRLRGGWSSWSGNVHAVTKPLPPRNVHIEDLVGALRIEWEPGRSLMPVDGYRIRYEPHGEPEQEFTVREDTAITIPTERSCGEYALRIAAFSDEFGEGPSLLRHTEVKYRCGWVAISFSPADAACVADRGAPAVVLWTVTGGVAPFKIAVQGHKPLYTDERLGWIRIYCQADSSEDTRSIPAMVTDAAGGSSTAKVELLAKPTDRWPGGPHSIEIDELRMISVFRNEVRVSWWCNPWIARWIGGSEPVPPRALLRWRNAESPEWTYVNATATPIGGKVNNGCHWTWAGLEPRTHYEFQLAAWLRPEELDAPEWLRWSPLESVTTLGDPEDLRVSRDQDAVIATWRAQPHAWAYQVVLRGNGESWWKYYLPSGNDVERAVFRNVPPGGSYAVEIITPPRVTGEPETEPGLILPIPPEY